MGIEFSFFSGLKQPERELKRIIMDIVKDDDIVGFSEDAPENWSFACDYYTCFVNGRDSGTELFSKDFMIDLRRRFEFDIFLEDWEQGEKRMMEIIGAILSVGDDDCLLLANGDTPIVMRRDGRTVVDDSRWVEREYFPYEALGVDFDWGVIPYD